MLCVGGFNVSLCDIFCCVSVCSVLVHVLCVCVCHVVVCDVYWCVLGVGLHYVLMCVSPVGVCYVLVCVVFGSRIAVCLSVDENSVLCIGVCVVCWCVCSALGVPCDKSVVFSCGQCLLISKTYSMTVCLTLSTKMI